VDSLTVRILDAIGENLINSTRDDLKKAIRAAAGRVIVAETVAFKAPLIDGVTNVELLKSWGADMVNVNHYSVDMPMTPGLPSTEEGLALWGSAWTGSPGRRPEPEVVEPSVQSYFLEFGLGRTIGEVKQLAGVPVGMTLDPVGPDTRLAPARIASRENAQRGVEHGASFITLIHTPSMSEEQFAGSVKEVRAGAGDQALVLAGKMPWGGPFTTDPDEFITKEEIARLSEAGADVIIIPAPGTVPGLTIEIVKSWVQVISSLGLLAEVTIGTSQEGADPGVITRIAIDSKMTGADLYQIGDGVYSGVATCENVMAFANAIKGKRHTLRRAALSPLR
jgi:hypothetical protein